MRNIKKLLIILSAILFVTTPAMAVTILPVQQGGTGWGYPGGFQANTLLTGNGTGAIATTTIGSGLTLSGGILSSTGTFPFTPQSWGNSTSTTLGFLNGFISTASSTFSSLGTGELAINNGLVYNSATTTFSSPLLYSNGNVTCQTASGSLAGCLLSTDWTTFNGKQATISVTWPITLAGATVGFGGLSTSTAAVQGNLPYFSGVNTFANVATSSISVGTSLSVTGGSLGSQVGGTAVTINTIQGIRTADSPTFNGLTLTNPLTVANGGTGQNTFTSSNLLYGNGTTALSSVATSTLSCTGAVSCTGTTVISTASSINLASISGGVLGSVASAVPSAQATSTLYGPAFTALTTYNVGISSTTPAFRFSVNNAGSDFYIDSTGKIVGRDTTNAWSGRLSPTHSFVLSVGTTTSWQGTTTGAYIPSLTMPFAGTLRQARCNATTTAAFLNVAPYIGTTQTTPGSFIASSTVGLITFTANNTFSVGNVVSIYVGTSTVSSANQAVSCTFDTTET